MVCPPVATKTIKRSLNPSWNEEIVFRVNPLENRLVFELYDENRLTRDAFLGLVAVSLPHLEIAFEDSGQRILAKSFMLRPRTPHSRVRGQLHLYFAYLPINVDPRFTTTTQLPQPRSPTSLDIPQSAALPSSALESLQPSPPELTDPASVRNGAAAVADSSGLTNVEEEGDSGSVVEEICASLDFVPDPLPPGWDERRDQNNRTYYVDHINRRTQWDRPTFRLPDGWEQRTDANGRVYYVDHINRRTTWYHPLSAATSRLRLDSASWSSLTDSRAGSDPEVRNSDDESATEDANDQSSSSPDQVVNATGPCGSASPTLIVTDTRGSLTSRSPTDTARPASGSTDPSTSRSRRPLAPSRPSRLVHQASAQNANDEVMAARTMYLRRRPVSFEDTLSHPPPQSDTPPNEGQPEQTSVEPNEHRSPAESASNRSDAPTTSTTALVVEPTPAVTTTDGVQSTGLTSQPLDISNEEPLPSGWEVVLTAEGRRLFLNHVEKRTTWHDPRQQLTNIPATSVLKSQSERHVFKDLGPLPPGWEERVDPKGRIFYIDHNKKTTQWEDPRLKGLSSPAVPYSRDFKQKYDFFRSHLRGPRDPQAKLELRVRRSHILEDSFRLIYGIKKPEYLLHSLWIEFIGEKGLDYGGLRREWFFSLSREMFNPYYGLFEYSAADKYTLQINPLSGLANEDHLKYFKFIGRVVGMAVFNGKLIDGFLIRPFYKMMLGRPITLKDMESVDSEYYRSLKYILENDPTPLELTFSVNEEKFGETTEVDLIPDGRQIRVTNSNKKQYIEHIINWRFASRVKEQMWAFLDGFKDVIDLKTLKLFDANELELLICGLQDINVADWRANTLYKGEYHANHLVVANFWKAVYTFPNELRSRLLQFVTGTSRVPMNGFAELWGSNGPQKFTIDCWGTAAQLPRAHTCFNRLDLPPYTTFHELRTKLIIAIENAEGYEGVD